jgi:hypothetical protein
MLVRDSIPTSINFFFKKEKKGIILEDDVLPSKSFYFFCKKALQTYKNNKSILCITGFRFQKNKNKNIYLSKYPHIWGWATWRSSWKKYDVDMKFWPKFKKMKRFKDFNFNKKECNYWTKIFDKTYLKKINTWDFQWLAASWYYNKFCVIPPINLVQNIGFGLDAENTISREKFIKNKNLKIFFNIPKKLERNHINDYYVFLSHFKALSIFEKIIKYIKLFFSDPIFFFIVIYKKLLLNKR